MTRTLGMALLLALIGCSTEPPLEVPETFPVTGKVVGSKGTPVADALVDFRLESGESNLIVNGLTDANGEFEISTRHINDRKLKLEKVGAPAGTYRLTIILKQPEDQQQGFAPPVTWPQTVTVGNTPTTLTLDLGKAPASK